ncbi:MAG: ComEC/Rec2 family competence protein [Anaerolineaceae bacterium]|nr:ComEC/Rec2 family competence protein [Anaerolineaceae bacterium]
MRLVTIALGWMAGIVLAANSQNRPTLIWLALVILAGIALWSAWPDTPWRRGALVLLAFTLGGLRFSFVPVTSNIAQYNNTGGLTIEGIITAEPDSRDDRVQLQVAAETLTRGGQTVPTDGLVLVQAPPVTDVHYGDRITATGLLSLPAEFDTFSYADYLGRTGVFSIMRNAAVEVVSGGHGSPITTVLLDLKTQAARLIARSLPEPAAGLLTGMLLGNESGIAPEVADAFSKVGASHVIAISGFNMAVVSGVLLGLLERFRASRRWSAIITISVLVVYTLFVGANPAVVRAAIMSGMLVIGSLLRRKTYVPASLAFVAVLMSLQNPTVLWDISFQLSFFATLGLALFVDPISRWFNRLLARTLPRGTATRVGDFLAEPLVVTLAAQITTLPLIIVYFGRLSLVSLVVNLLIIPVQSYLFILGLLATLIAFVLPLLAQILYWMTLILLAWTIGVVRLFARLPFADVEYHIDPRLVAFFFLVMIGGALMHATQPAWALRLARTLRQRAVVTAVALASLALTLLMVAVALSRPDGDFHIWLLDMGQSNAILVQTPGGAHVLIDGGHFPSRLLTALGDRLPFNDSEIEALVITQPDEADYGALTAVLARYDVGVVLMNGQPNLSEAFVELEDALKGREVVVARAGYVLETSDGVRLEVLSPQQQPQLDDSLDDSALTLRLTYDDISFLLPGDLSREGQTALLDSGAWPLATVLQLPRHGGVRSLDGAFLAAVQPQVVLLQNDPANRRGDPDGDTLALLGDTPLFRTDIDGSLHLYSDGHDLWLVGE